MRDYQVYLKKLIFVFLSFTLTLFGQISFAKSHKAYRRQYQQFVRSPAHVVPVPTPPPGACSVDFNETVKPIKMRGSHIYVSLNDLNFLKSEYGFYLQDVELEVTYKDKTNKKEALNLALNGIKTSIPGGLKANASQCGKYKLHQILINGTESFHQFIMRLKRNRGLLKITILGRHPQIVSAKVTFKGKSFVKCNPNPGTTSTTSTTSTSTSTSTSTTSTSTTSTSTSTSTTSTTTTTIPPEDLSQYQIQIDSVSPSQILTSSPNILINFSTSANDATYWCALDSEVYDKCQSPFSFAGLVNGNHTFKVYAQTPRGIVASDPISYSWTVDNTAPSIQITNIQSLPSLTNQSSMTFQFMASKPSTYKCSLDGATASACSSPMTYNLFSEGLHKFSVQAIDRAGNVSGNSAYFQWTLDLSPPISTISAVVPSESLSKNPQRSVAFSANETSDFECSLDNSGFSTCESPMELLNLSEGPHQLEVRAIDLAGNIGAPISTSWRQDYTPPELTLGNISPGLGLTNSPQASVEFFMNEAGKIICRWDSMDPQECQSPAKFNFDGDGVHYLLIYAVDLVGNRSAPLNLNWSLDSTAPLIAFMNFNPSSQQYISSRNFSVSVQHSEQITWSASLNDQPIPTNQDAISLENLADGSYHLLVQGTDAAGNLSNQIEHHFVVDTQAPTVQLIADSGNLTNFDHRLFTFNADEESRFECSLDEAGFSACQSPLTLSGLADGDHNFILKATDLAGNQSVQSSTWIVDSIAPTTSLNSVQNSSSINFTFVSSETANSFICSLDGSSYVSCSSPLVYSNLSTGSHTFTTKAIDSAGNIDPLGASANFIIYPPLQTTIAGSNPSGSIVSTKNMSLSFGANQPTSGYLCSLDGSPFSSCTSPINYSSLADGNHNFIVQAIDQFGVRDQIGAAKTWTIDSTAPQVTSLSANATTNSITVTWFLGEAGTGKVLYGVNGNLNQTTIESSTTANSYSIKLTGLSSNTLYSIQVSGKDAAGNVYNSTIISVRTSR